MTNGAENKTAERLDKNIIDFSNQGLLLTGKSEQVYFYCSRVTLNSMEERIFSLGYNNR